MAAIARGTYPTTRSAAALLAAALLSYAGVARAQVVRLDDVLAAHPVDPERGSSVTEVLRGASASVNVWQITEAMPAHLHREHEEVIVVRSGRARAQIGDETVELGPGDAVLVPRDTVHGARAIGEQPMVGFSVFVPAFDGKDRVPAPVPSAAEDESRSGSR
ncbi:MAG: cupin domain-containing protein [Thermodesulfobacteriota bacterium]